MGSVLTSKYICEKLTEFINKNPAMDGVRTKSWKLRLKFFPSFNEYLEWEKHLFCKNGKFIGKFKRLNKFALKDGNIIRGFVGHYPLDCYFHVITNKDDTEILDIILVGSGSTDGHDFDKRVGKYA